VFEHFLLGELQVLAQEQQQLASLQPAAAQATAHNQVVATSAFVAMQMQQHP
jgi:hypothetical protein